MKVEKGDAGSHQAADERAGVLAYMEDEGFFGTRLKAEGEYARTIEVGGAVSSGLYYVALHEAETGDIGQEEALPFQKGFGSL